MQFKKNIIKIIKKVIPAQFHPEAYLGTLILNKSSNNVLSGPFQGLKYNEKDESIGSAYWPKLIGSYEKELHDVIEKLLISENKVDSIVNIGAAEGYYAIGFAIRKPNVQIIAFESQSKGRDLIQNLAENNGVANKISTYGFCNPDILLKSLLKLKNPLIICDVEGYELELLNPKLIDFKNAHLLVEVHDFIDNRIGVMLRERFEDSHKITQIYQRQRDRNDFPITNLYTQILPFNYLNVFLNEHRPEVMYWYFMEPQQRQQS